MTTEHDLLLPISMSFRRTVNYKGLISDDDIILDIMKDYFSRDKIQITVSPLNLIQYNTNLN